MQTGLTTGEEKPASSDGGLAGVKKYIFDFAALPTQVYWVLLLEVLNSYRSFGISAARYIFIAVSGTPRHSQATLTHCAFED